MKKKYNIEHRKVKTQYMLYEEQVSWIKRNIPPDFKSESEFVSHILSLGIQTYQDGVSDHA
jgi:hypothetical protein